MDTHTGTYMTRNMQ